MCHSLFWWFCLSVTVEHDVIKGPIDRNHMWIDYDKHIKPHSDAISSIYIVLCFVSTLVIIFSWELRKISIPSLCHILYPGIFFPLMNISTSWLHIVHVVFTVCPVIFECHAFKEKKRKKNWKKTKKTSK